MSNGTTVRFVRLKKQPLVLPCTIGDVPFGMFPCVTAVDVSRLPYLLKNFSEWMEECDENGKREDDPVEEPLVEEVPVEAETAVAEAAQDEPDSPPVYEEEAPSQEAESNPTDSAEPKSESPKKRRKGSSKKKS